MARSGKTAQEFIEASFSPIIAILSSSKVDNAVSKNNLSFVELLQPFTTLDWEGQFREPNGTNCVIKNWKVIVRDINWKPLQPTEARRQLNNAVLNNYNDKTVTLELGGRKFNVPQTTPWFDSWRETYFEVQFPSDHEFTKHFLSCMLVATTHDENITETFNMLNQQFAQFLNVAPPKLPKWFNNNVLKSYVLLHDVSSVPKDKADTMFETMKQTLDPNSCFMLSINSRSTVDQLLTTDLWAQYIKHNPISNSKTSSLSNLPGTPQDSQIVVTQANADEDPNFTTTSHHDGTHPLTAVETDAYDNANSLQTHSFSGSAESVSIAGKPYDLSTEVHGAALNATDIDSLKKFMQDYTSKALLPYIEKQIAVLSEVVANRKGVSRSLLSATKRWFGTGKAGNTTVNNTVIYSSDCPELQLRRLGDLWFMCGQWQRAFDAYHTAKREFYADGAWLCYAGALEMAALSAFMAGDANRKTHGYMEESITTYLNTCRMVQYSVRATLLSILCLNSAGLHGEAAKQLIRMTSEDSDLRSAMLLEQASLCFLSGPGSKIMSRKYAFHMVLAGHRFSKAGQKKHAYRCYKQAYEVYAGSGWRLATDHVQFALGRLASALKRPRDAADWLAAPLAPHSPQPRHQHRAFLRDYMLAHQQWIESTEPQSKLAALPLPLLERSQTAVLCAGPAPLSAAGRTPATSVSLGAAGGGLGDKYWHTLEQMLLQVARGAVPMIFKPTVSLYTAGTGEASPLVPQGEPIQVSITLKNPLKVALILKDVELLWRFLPDGPGGEWLQNEASLARAGTPPPNVVVAQKILSLTLDGERSETLTFSLTPLQVGTLVLHGVAYKLISTGDDNSENSSSVTISGKIDLDSSESKSNESGNSLTKRLQITVGPSAPCLQMTFSEWSTDMLCGEMTSIDVEFRNVGPVNMRNLHVAVSHPDCLRLVTAGQAERFPLLAEEKYREPLTDLEERTARQVAWRAAAARHVSGVGAAGGGGALPSGCATRCSLLLRPRRGVATLRLLAYYEPEEPATAHRLLRHEFKLNLTEAIQVLAKPRRSVESTGVMATEKMSLAVEVKNICNEKAKDLTVEVLEASLLSQQWRFKNLVAARDKNNGLSARERVHLILEAGRFTEKSPEKIEWSSLKIAKGNPDSEPDINVLPYSKFVYEFKTSFVEDEDYFLRANEKKPTGLIQSMLVVRWKSHDKGTGRTAIGQHCVWLDCFTKPKVDKDTSNVELTALDDSDKSDLMLSKSKNLDNVVLFKMEHTNQISHNFKQRKLCLIPITIQIINCYGVPVKAFIDMSKKGDQVCALGWAGALSCGPGGADVEPRALGVSVALGGFESRRVTVRAACARPGTYLVGSAFCVSTTTSPDAPDAVSKLCNDSSLLVVQQA